MRRNVSPGLALVVVLSACAPDKDAGDGVSFGKDTGADSFRRETDPTADVTDPPVEEGGLVIDGAVPDSTGSGGCGVGPAVDCDKDGYPQSVDCNDRDGTINPEAYDFPDDGIDNDCDGKIDNPVTTCSPTSLDTESAYDFARAADLCPQRSLTKDKRVFDPLLRAEWGAIAGSFPLPTTSATKPAQTKMMAAFGANTARYGTSMFGLSTGPFGVDKPRESKALDSFLPIQNACAAIPLKGKDCDSLTAGTVALPGFGATVQDWAELKLTVKVPSNAKALLFDFAFFSSEFNEYWKSGFNDAFFVLVTGKKVDGLNVAKDEKGAAITVNSGFFQLCPKSPGPTGVSRPDALTNCVGVDGDASKAVLGTLKGTFFDGAGIGSTDDTVISGKDKARFVYGGGSGWLTTKFAVEPGETLVMRIIVNDTSDGLLDSAAIVDGIRWEKAEPKVPTGGVERPPR